jgi:hypothetical protein
MLARLQQAMTLGLVALALGWAVVAWHQGHPAWMPVGALLVVGGYAAFMAMEFVLVAWVHGDDPAPRASAGQLLRAWWGEVTTAPGVFCWRQPFQWDAVPDVPGRPGQRGIVFIHGFVCNRGLWTPWLRRLQAQGRPFVAVSLEPVFGSIEAYADTIDAAVRTLAQRTGLPPVLVCHSMGGLAARAWLRRFGQMPNTRQMRLRSDWVEALAREEPPSRYTHFTCFYGHCDNIVFPASTATLPGADNRHLEGTAHVHMAFHPAVWDEAMRWLDAEPQTARMASPGSNSPASSVGS